jgi:hypothetical protein
MWISIGGAVFLGVYDKVKVIMRDNLLEKGYL